ncbi:hypothetical protein VTN49DRAFT_7330 [Thermomyces lanuginosus]|uniref:uncharacterized protein n=1 Tax=Thermomyces lanuginosus TaxID=5541 RepID=UPI0037430A6E
MNNSLFRVSLGASSLICNRDKPDVDGKHRTLITEWYRNQIVYHSCKGDETPLHRVTSEIFKIHQIIT